jgi:hypothetical protein
MARRIFDQAEQLKSAKAQRFADAFAGCDEWIEMPTRDRAADSDYRELGRPADSGPFDQQLDAGPDRHRRAA